MTITITNVQDSAENIVFDGDTIPISTADTGTTDGDASLPWVVTLDSTTATLAFDGAGSASFTTAELVAALDAATYTNTDQSPTAADRVITITHLADEGSDSSPHDRSAASGLPTTTITVAAVNDAPTATGTATLASLAEDSAMVGATVSSLFGGGFSDTDGDSLGGICITSYDDDTSEGQWKYSTNDGGAWTAFGADISAAASGIFVAAADELAFDNAADWNGAANTITAVLVDDSGSEPSTGATTNCATTGTTTVYSTATIALSHSISAVNDAPTTAGDTAQATEETVYDSWTADSDWGYSDTESVAMDHILIVTTVGSGYLAVDADAGDDCDVNERVTEGSTTVDDDALTNLLFCPAADSTTQVTFTFKVHDGNSYSASAGTMTISFTGVQDLPTASTGQPSTEPNEDAAHTFDAVEANWGYADVDGDSMTQVEITTVPSTGSLFLDANDDQTENGEEAVEDGDDIAIGDLGDLIYTPVANAYGAVTFTYKVHDGTAWSATAGTFTMTYQSVDDDPVAADSDNTGAV